MKVLFITKITINMMSSIITYFKSNEKQFLDKNKMSLYCMFRNLNDLVIDMFIFCS